MGLFGLRLTLLIWLSSWILFYTGAFIYMVVIATNYTEKTACPTVNPVVITTTESSEYFDDLYDYLAIKCSKQLKADDENYRWLIGAIVFVAIAWVYELIKLIGVAQMWRQVIHIFAALESVFLGAALAFFLAAIANSAPPLLHIIFSVLVILDFVEIAFMFMLANAIVKKRQAEKQQPIGYPAYHL